MDGKSREFSSVMVFEKKCAVCGIKENLLKCQGCFSIRYCGRQHQKDHWKLHKVECKEISARQKGKVEQICRLNELFENAVDLIKQGETNLFRDLIKNNPEIVHFECEEHSRATLLFPSAAWRNMVAVEILVEAGADVNFRDIKGFTPIYIAIREGNVPIVKYLLDHDAHVNLIYEYVETLLLEACIFKNYAIVKLLLEKNVNVNLQDSTGFTALMYACKKGSLPIVNLLLDVPDIDVNISTDDGVTALLAACLINEPVICKAIVFLLLQSLADVNATNINNNFPLLMAAKLGKTEIMNLLLEFGAIVYLNFQDEVGYTPLLVACEHNRFDAVKLLLEHNPDMTLTNRSGATALHLVCEDGYNDILKLLLEKDININIPTDNELGYTPLMIACQLGRRETIKILLQHNAHVSIVSPLNGASASSMALCNNHFDIVELLSNSMRF